MVKEEGLVWVALNHETDKELMVRVGRAYKCPKCSCIVIYKWEDYFETDKETLMSIGFWTVFLEDHTHHYKFHPKKSL